MFCEQVKFYDEENNLCFGIRAWTDADSWFIICACCGEYFIRKMSTTWRH